MNEQLRNDEVEIDLLDLASTLLDKWHYLLICLLAGALIMGAYSFFCIAPTYQATSKLYIVSASDDSVVSLSDLNLGTSADIRLRTVDAQLSGTEPRNRGTEPGHHFRCIERCIQADQSKRYPYP